MLRRKIMIMVGLASLSLAAVTAAQAAECPPPPPSDCRPADGSLDCLTPYARGVMYGNAPAVSPVYYWRLGEDLDFALDWMQGVGSTLDLGSQVQRSQPGALACDEDGSVALSGAVSDQVWESHLVGDPDGVRAAAPGTAPFGLAIWVKPNRLDANSRRIMGHELPAGGYFLAARSDRLSFTRYEHGDGSSHEDTIALSHGLPNDRWSFVVATYDADHVMHLYVDGVQVAEGDSKLALPDDPSWDFEHGEPAGTGRLVLGASGRSYDARVPTSRMYLEWDGGLDEAAFYGDRIPEASDVDRLWRIGTTGWSSDLPG
ncbi:hypothetical protein DSM104299_04141 [Baekduia alba]|uniref:LamG-like jellyroll fold domain-containing protein n=1 Tax=Baekduia alba TaxID=2997333 RepID=UPI0023424DB2|nr:LamG-like jellyroll fold domain-containing protein [Baekduia alba]WCB95398.1 hypothetical protein DSM104299_04141 [Baekduia alba]